MSFKYKFLLKMFRVLNMQKIMALPPEKSQKLFRKAYKGVVIPDMSDAELDIETAQVPDYMKYLQLGDYTGLSDVYLSFGGDEVFAAAAESIKAALEKYGVKVTLEIGEGMYHSYAALPLVKEAEEGYRHMISYIST